MVRSVVDALVEKNRLVGAVNNIWQQLEGKQTINMAIVMRTEEEERDNKLLLEIHMREERMESEDYEVTEDNEMDNNDTNSDLDLSFE